MCASHLGQCTDLLAKGEVDEFSVAQPATLGVAAGGELEEDPGDRACRERKVGVSRELVKGNLKVMVRIQLCGSEGVRRQL